MLDMSGLRGVQVDPARRVARAEPGSLLSDVDRETQAHGLAAVLGFVSATGCAGLTLGGGFGYLTRRFGWTTDNLVSIELATADGRVVRASEDENSDLFWGPCGGGGNFGVATSFEYQVGPEVFAGAVAWRGEEAGSVLELYRSIVTEAPRELTCVASLRLAPPAPCIAKEVHGKPIVALFVCYTGRLEDAEQVLAPIKGFGSPVGDILQRRTYVAQQSLLDATQPKGRRYYWKSEYLRSFEPALLTRAIEQASRIVSPHSAILIFPIDGALNELPEDHSSVRNRDAVGVLNIAASWERPQDDQAASNGPGTPGAICGSSPREGPTSTSSPKRKATTARARRTGPTTRAWRGSRLRGTRRTCSTPTRTSAARASREPDRPWQPSGHKGESHGGSEPAAPKRAARRRGSPRHERYRA